MGSKRDARQFARRIDRIERTQRAMTRSRQIAFSDVPVIIDGVEVSVGVPDLLQETVNNGVDLVLAKQLAESAKLAADAAAEAADAASEMAQDILTTNVQPLEEAWEAFYDEVDGQPLTMAGIRQDIQEADAAASTASGAAATAQQKAVDAQALADKAAAALKAVTQQGENMILDGGVSDSSLWSLPSPWAIDSTTVPGGGTALVHNGGPSTAPTLTRNPTAPGTRVGVPVSEGQVWEVRARCYIEAAITVINTGNTKIRVSNETGTPIITAPSPNLSLRDQWQVVSARFTINATTKFLTATLPTDNTTGKVWWDDFVLVNVTAVAAAQKAADDAQADADQAITDAYNAAQTADQAAADVLLAQSKADSAFGLASTADGRMTVASSNPTANDAVDKPMGAVWEVRSGGITLRRYVITSLLPAAWTQVKIGAEYVGDKAIGRAQIGDAAIGTLQVGDAQITDAKIGDLDAGKLWARSVTTDKLMVTDQTNYWNDPGLAHPAGYNSWTVVNGGLERTSAATTVGATAPHTRVAVEPSTKYRWSYTRTDTGGTPGSGQITLLARYYDAAGAQVSFTAAATVAGQGDMSAEITTHASAAYAEWGIRQVSTVATGTLVRITRIAIRRMENGTLILPDSILTPMIGTGQVVTEHLHGDVGRDLNISSNQDIILTAGAAQAAQGAAQTALEQVAPLTELPGQVTAAQSAAAAAASTAAKGVSDAETAKKAAEAAQGTANTAKLTADTVTESVRQHQMRYAFTTDGLVISQPGSENAVTIDNDSIEMVQSGVAVSYWKGGTFHADTLEADVMRFGKHQIEKYPLDSATPTGTIVKAI